MKTHIRVIHSIATTVAIESDVSQSHKTLHGDEKYVHVDACYTGAKKRDGQKSCLRNLSPHTAARRTRSWTRSALDAKSTKRWSTRRRTSVQGSSMCSMSRTTCSGIASAVTRVWRTTRRSCRRRYRWRIWCCRNEGCTPHTGQCALRIVNQGDEPKNGPVSAILE